MIKKIVYDGNVVPLLKLFTEMGRSATALRAHGRGVTIPTELGARTVYIGDTVYFDMAEKKIVINCDFEWEGGDGE